MPVVMAGYMRVCRALEEEEEVELTHLFEGFQKHTARLVALGGFPMLGLLGRFCRDGVHRRRSAAHSAGTAFNSANDPQMLVDAMWTAGSGVAFSLLVGFTLVCVLMLALQYAPMLVFFNDVTPLAALRASLSGSLRNIIPYTVYNIIMQVVALVLSMLPYNIGLIVLLPLGLTSLYVSYRNIFPFAHELAATRTSYTQSGDMTMQYANATKEEVRKAQVPHNLFISGLFVLRPADDPGDARAEDRHDRAADPAAAFRRAHRLHLPAQQEDHHLVRGHALEDRLHARASC